LKRSCAAKYRNYFEKIEKIMKYQTKTVKPKNMTTSYQMIISLLKVLKMRKDQQ